MNVLCGEIISVPFKNNNNKKINNEEEYSKNTKAKVPKPNTASHLKKHSDAKYK